MWLLDIAHTTALDLIVLDLRLPDIGGEEVAPELRRTSDVAIVMLTAKVDERERIAGLEVGADDYVKNLRRKLEPDAATPPVVQTVTGVGYRLGIDRDR